MLKLQVFFYIISKLLQFNFAHAISVPKLEFWSKKIKKIILRIMLT